MSLIKASELAYCRLRVPDFPLAEQFLNDFGLITTYRTRDAVYLRGTDPMQYCYVLEKGEAHFLGFAFHAKSEADIQLVAKTFKSPIEEIDAPGGGRRVRLREPNGYDVDVVVGIADADPIEIKRQPLNTGTQPLLRAGELMRLPKGKPTPVKRLAHVVMGSSLIAETTSWFQDTLGLIPSDEIYAGAASERKKIGAFMRVDAGAKFVDHHAYFVIRSPRSGLGHISFEAQDMDGVLADNFYLTSLRKYEHLWGIGRHFLGSQVFDYWLDPFGYVHEHWSDTDRLNADAPTTEWDAKDGLCNQWGEPSPDRFRECLKP
jgi:catechol 2,3-dioxygenase-like lactoylglutathione lyase family enzyme